MKRTVFLFLALILTLSGCAVKGAAIPEYVMDTLEITPEPQFQLVMEIPTAMYVAAVYQQGPRKIYSDESEDFEMITDVFTAASLDEALMEQTGYDSASLDLVTLNNAYADYYQFAWTSAGEPQELACCGCLLFDGQHYYTLTIRCDAEKEKALHDRFVHILSTVSLQGLEDQP